MARTTAPGAATLIRRHRPAHDGPGAPREELARPVTTEAAGNSSPPEPASSPPGPDRGRRLAGAWRMASQAFRAGRNRLEPTIAGRVWKQLSELGFMTRSLEFAAVFTLGFIPFLMVLSVALGSDLARAIVIRGGFRGKAAHDVAMLFAHGRMAPTGLSVLGLVLAVIGGAAISQILQTWYARIFRTKIHGWKAMARRAEWLVGVSGFVALQVVIGRRVQPLGGYRRGRRAIPAGRCFLVVEPALPTVRAYPLAAAVRGGAGYCRLLHGSWRLHRLGHVLIDCLE